MATKHKTLRAFQAGRGYSRSDWEGVSDNGAITKEEAEGLRPFREVLPGLAKAMDDEVAKRGRPPKEVVKQPVTIRLNPDTIEKFKATGKGWQSRISDILDAAKPKRS